MLVLNSSLARPPASKGLKVLSFPFTDIAIKLGNIKVANMVALGCYLAAGKTVGIKEVLKVFNFMVPAGRQEILEVNQRALQEGVNLVNG